MRTKSEVEGRYRIEAFRTDFEGNEVKGSRRIVSDWFPNLILDSGLDRMNTSDVPWFSFCQVGSGSAPPAPTETSLVNRIAATNTLLSSSRVYVPGEEPYIYTRQSYRFGEGVAAGNLSEVGVGWAATGSLFSRALVLDGAGSPTTIVVLPDEYLDVIYEYRIYPPVSDLTGSFVIDGTTYTWTSRASLIQDRWAHATGSNYGISNNYGGTTVARLYPGTIGSTTGAPSGTAVSGVTMSLAAYVAGSHKRSITVTVPLAVVVAGGVRSFAIASSNAPTPSYQIQFDPAIPKTTEQIMTFTFEHSWSRR